MTTTCLSPDSARVLTRALRHERGKTPNCPYSHSAFGPLACPLAPTSKEEPRPGSDDDPRVPAADPSRFPSFSFSLCTIARAHRRASTRSPAGGMPRAIRSQAERGVRPSSTTRYPAAAAKSPTTIRFAFSRRRTARIHATTLDSGSCGPTKSALMVVPHRKR